MIELTYIIWIAIVSFTFGAATYNYISKRELMKQLEFLQDEIDEGLKEVIDLKDDLKEKEDEDAFIQS